jgi:DNA-binding MarR family transcriptional regulator
MLVVGLGIGMVMQVLVLAVQNAVPYEDLGVATSGATLFRFIGGSLGTAALGAVFADRLHASLMRHGVQGVSGEGGLSQLSPTSLGLMPAAVRRVYVAAFTESLGTVFLLAALVTALAFVLALVLQERPLRHTVAAGSGVGQGFAIPQDEDSVNQVTRWVWGLLSRENKRRLLERIAARAGVHLSPAACWLLARFNEIPETTITALARRFDVDPARLDAGLLELGQQGLVTESRTLTPAGQGVLERLVAARHAGLTELLADWSPEQHRELSVFLRRVAGDLAQDVPI